MLKFIYKTLFYSAPILLILGYFYLYIYNNTSGDIGRLGMIPFGTEYDNIFKDKINKEIHFQDIYTQPTSNAEIITIGDSFSQRGEIGYQNYLGQIIGQTIYNIPQSNNSPEHVLLYLLQRKQLKGVKIVILESVERSCIERLSNFSIEEEMVLDTKIIDNTKSNTKTFMPQFGLWLRNITRLDKTILKAKLNTALFSHEKYHSTLYFYNSAKIGDGDLCFRDLNEDKYIKAASNLNSLYKMAHEQNIKLIYLVATNKYDLYSQFIDNNQYPLDPTFNKLDSLGANYINTKKILLPYLKKGVKDIYYINDTHWSPIGAKIVAEELHRIITEE